MTEGLHFSVLVWATRFHSQDQESSLFCTHTTILVHARTSHYKFDGVWKLTRRSRYHTESSFITNGPIRHGRTIISTKNFGVLGLHRGVLVRELFQQRALVSLGTASICISMCLVRITTAIIPRMATRLIFQQRA